MRTSLFVEALKQSPLYRRPPAGESKLSAQAHIVASAPVWPPWASTMPLQMAKPQALEDENRHPLANPRVRLALSTETP